MHEHLARGYWGILLAAGRGTRFDPSGEQNKLMQVLAGGPSVAVASATHLLAVVSNVIAVVRPGQEDLAQQLSECGCKVSVCARADEGMGATLVHALRQTSQAQGWVVALGDMPWVAPATIRKLIDAVEQGAQIAVPCLGGERGNPVAFSRAYLPDLLSLHGDEGARRLLKTFPVTEVLVDDPGVRLDVDTRRDLFAAHSALQK